MDLECNFRFTAIARFTYGADQGCGGQVNVDTSTQIQSVDTDNDGNYEANLNCQWILSGQAGKILKLTFTRFNVEREQNSTSVTCWDYVEVRDGHSPFSPLIGHFCGTQVPAPLHSSSNFMWVKFFSDSTNNQAGFSATVQNEDPVCGGVININDTTTSEVLSKKQLLSLMCLRKIQGPAKKRKYCFHLNGQKRTLDFDSFPDDYVTSISIKLPTQYQLPLGRFGTKKRTRPFEILGF